MGSRNDSPVSVEFAVEVRYRAEGRWWPVGWSYHDHLSAQKELHRAMRRGSLISARIIRLERYEYAEVRRHG